MRGLFKALFACGLVLMHVAGAAGDTITYGPSTVALGMDGALGRFDFQPADWQEGESTWWEDTDGVAPGTPGCHIGTDSEGTPNGRMFAEACLPDGTLVESNPGIGVLHIHRDDTGHPDTFDCNAWCIGEGAASGACVVAAAPLCEHSAKCDCR